MAPAEYAKKENEWRKTMSMIGRSNATVVPHSEAIRNLGVKITHNERITKKLARVLSKINENSVDAINIRAKLIDALEMKGGEISAYGDDGYLVRLDNGD